MAALFCMVLLPELLPYCRDLRYIMSGACLKRCACAKTSRAASPAGSLRCLHACSLMPGGSHGCIAALGTFWVVLPQLLLLNANMCLTLDWMLRIVSSGTNSQVYLAAGRL